MNGHDDPDTQPEAEVEMCGDDLVRERYRVRPSSAGGWGAAQRALARKVHTIARRCETLTVTLDDADVTVEFGFVRGGGYVVVSCSTWTPSSEAGVDGPAGLLDQLLADGWIGDSLDFLAMPWFVADEDDLPLVVHHALAAVRSIYAVDDEACWDVSVRWPFFCGTDAALRTAYWRELTRDLHVVRWRT